ncbi:MULTISPECIES: cell division protein SepF [Halostella]|uniref:cell division protein SepF n=1 Tax=Halostella TaxID=1843185 RepID=UPI001081BBAA|nr:MULTISPECIES: cell division protein SepF [Halostella]
MGLMSKILGDRNSRSTGDYVELNPDDFDAGTSEAAMEVHIAEIAGKEDVIDIKDAVYDGDLIIADITRLRTEDPTVEHITDELRQVAEEVGGDIVQKGDDQIIVTPTGVSISREKLGTR